MGVVWSTECQIERAQQCSSVKSKRHLWEQTKPVQKAHRSYISGSSGSAEPVPTLSLPPLDPRLQFYGELPGKMKAQACFTDDSLRYPSTRQKWLTAKLQPHSESPDRQQENPAVRQKRWQSIWMHTSCGRQDANHGQWLMGAVRDLEGIRLVTRTTWMDLSGCMCTLCEDIHVPYNRDIHCGRSSQKSHGQDAVHWPCITLFPSLVTPGVVQ